MTDTPITDAIAKSMENYTPDAPKPRRVPMTTFQLWIVGILLFLFVVTPIAVFSIGALGDHAEKKFDSTAASLYDPMTTLRAHSWVDNDELCNDIVDAYNGGNSASKIAATLNKAGPDSKVTKTFDTETVEAFVYVGC